MFDHEHSIKMHINVKNTPPGQVLVYDTVMVCYMVQG